MASEEEVIIDLRKMRIPELKKELQERNLKTSGNKQELIERLQQYLEEHEGAEVADDEILKEDDGEIDDNFLSDDKKLDEASDDAVLSVQIEQKEEVKDEKPKQEEKTDEEKAEDEKSAEKTTLSSQAGLTDKQKLELRAKKFGMSVTDMNVDARKAARSERFGTGTGSISNSGVTPDPDKLKKRAERFGISASQTSQAPPKTGDEERMRKRQARFGAATSAGSGDLSDEKKKKRAERFGLSVA